MFSQILKLVTRHEVESLARTHHQGRKLRKMTRWSQFVSLGRGAAHRPDKSARCGQHSNLKEQAGKLYLPQPKTLTTNLYARHRPAKEKVCSEAD
jgi:putative transposase